VILICKFKKEHWWALGGGDDAANPDGRVQGQQNKYWGGEGILFSVLNKI